MYKHVWNKYLPIIRILLKRTPGGAQTLAMNATDFERASAGRKAGYKFQLHFVQGRVQRPVSTSPVAADLLDVLLQDGIAKDVLQQNEVVFEMTPKFNLSITATPVTTTSTALPAEAALS